MDYSNPNDSWLNTGYDPFKDLDHDQRVRASFYGCAAMIIAFMLGILLCMLIGGCTTSRAVEEHHHHHYEADTAAVHAQVDRQLSSWHEEMTQFFNQKLDQYTSQQQQSEQQHETITETVTVSLDSLGREVRQEQRTITRDITRELQQQEQRITQEMQEQLRVVVDSVNNSWQSRYDSIASHVAQLDSTFVKKTPVGDTRPWYQRWWSSFRVSLISILLVAFVLFTLPFWKKLLKRLV